MIEQQLLARAQSLHDKAGMPWDEAEQLALDEFGISNAAIDELIGECAPLGMDSLLTCHDDLRRFTRAILVHGTDGATIGAVASTAGLGVWIPITDSLPESGKPVLVACGKKVLRAAYAAKFSLSEENWGWWNDGEGADYNEADDTTYWPEGWYEWNEYEETHWAIADHPVSHWMPLPKTPNA